MIRICFYIETNGYGGCENHLLQLIENVASKEFEITVVIHSSSQREINFSLLQTKLNKLLEEKYIIKLFFFETEYLGLKALKNIGYIKKLYSFINNENSIFHFYKPSLGRCAVPSILCSLLSKPSIQTIQLPPSHYITNTLSLKRFRQRLYLNSSDYIITVSESAKKDFVRYFNLPSEKIIAIHNGINSYPFVSTKVTKEEKRKSLEKELVINLEGKTLLLNVARLDEQKGQIFLIEGLRLLKERSPDYFQKVIVLCVGAGELEVKLKSLVVKYELQETILFLGHRNDIAELLRSADAFILTSLYEGLPLTIVEAMVMQLPVIATNINGNNEIVLNGETGLLVTPGDESAIEKAIIQLLSMSENDKINMGIKGRKRALEEFDHGQQSEKVRNIYRSILGTVNSSSKYRESA
ncbi:MAG: glycosyltransferase family 4 protein [Ignavibacteriae bacterium]|nr:glycosyltransferase family 4 protein [Ignavibacteriota bacterium]